MQHIRTQRFRQHFKPVAKTQSAQLACMVLRPGDASDDQPSNEHPRCEQWLFVVSGVGHARIGKTKKTLRRIRLARGSLLIIEKDELHQIKNVGGADLVTINIYIPPAYDANAEPLNSVKKKKR
jgi:mannose-6-phosphate isomerase-like protein (cupin superfamily)